MKIALLCGGPSLERGISLNSARSVLDHLDGSDYDISPIYFDLQKRAFRISKSQLYSNTPSDFDFKLRADDFLAGSRLITELKKSDLVFPVIHGTFGEDGEIQSFLEKNNIPFVGSGSISCKLIFDKFNANQFLKTNGFYVLPSAVVKIFDKRNENIIRDFFWENKIKRAIVKPASGGSSIGVFSVETAAEAYDKSELIFSKRMDTRVVIEPFATGIEFTVIVLQNKFGLPVAVLPTEIETDYDKNQIFDFRKKYLPTRHVTYHCPPRFADRIVEKIQIQAEQIFSIAKMRDFARFDGWVLPDGKIWFSDLNPISGMEQNSFLFQQASRVGLSHRGILEFIITKGNKVQKKVSGKKVVNVLFGGQTSERQVSVMSGTNVWLKLRLSDKYEPIPYLLDLKKNVWQLPYSYCLNHTVEEIAKNCQMAAVSEKRLRMLELRVRTKLGLPEQFNGEFLFLPQKKSLDKFIEDSKFVFIGLHGGFGENGELQKILEKKKVKFNGSGSAVSKLCMDKWLTASKISRLNISGLVSIPRKLVKISNVSWNDLKSEIGTEIIAKPNADGCSSGIVRLQSENDLLRYVDMIKTNCSYIPKNTFFGQDNQVEMPQSPIDEILFEKFIETDYVRVRANKLKYVRKNGWVEVTIGFVRSNNKLQILNPSITVAESDVLSVEEKFQGGTGVNLTPPPKEIVSTKAIVRAKKLISQVVLGLNLNGYGRIDAFLSVDTGELIIIEVNSLPGLTPSTVLFHQGLAENSTIYPQKLIENIIEAADY